VALIVDAEDLFPDNWIYIHSPEVTVGRIQNFKNWSPAMVPDPTKTCLGMEYFCSIPPSLSPLVASMLALQDNGDRPYQFDPDLLKLPPGAGLVMCHLWMMRAATWQKPWIFVKTLLGNLRWTIVLRLKYGSRLETDAVAAAELEFFRSWKI
jgi:hypothetical protein